MQIPEAAKNFILFAEVGSQRDYTPTLKWPGGASGVTMGVGYDLGYHSAAQISLDWRRYVSVEDLQRLMPACRVIGGAALLLTHSLADITVPFDAAADVFENTSIPRAIEQTAATFANCDLLPPLSFGALVSLVYNRGPDISPTPNRLEMAQIADAMRLCQFNLIPDAILRMCRLWQWPDGRPKAGMAGLLTRRKAEATMFSTGMANTPPDPKAVADRLDTEVNQAEQS